ncbi:SIR2 family protein [Mesorhizobium sp. WSM4310]|uniref:SIR2 family protein n=1 Tax=Mesorhizobium sp. WSM4310 TaxID=2589883 RepID=UPI002484B955|nr:SIR2 family protein [Mesorhizobium sp. WSM4310]
MARLRPLRLAGGLLGIPQFPWQAIFSTNYDLLIENSYKIANIPLTAIRSNYDLTYREDRTGTTLYKIHGCITQDSSLGNKGSMIITEQDYDDYRQYRQSLFTTFDNTLMTGDVLIVGQSLRDQHLSDRIKLTLAAKDQGLPGQVYILIYDEDDLRAPLLEDRGAKICFGGIDEFVHALANIKAPATEIPSNPSSILPLVILSSSVDVATSRHTAANVTRMFNGGSASFADIQSNSTFQRTSKPRVVDDLIARRKCSVSLIGPAGVGKTTFARQLLMHMSDLNHHAFEHRSDFPFQSRPWEDVESNLRGKGERGFLLLDECTRFMRQTGALIDYLSSTENPALQVILTANAAQWAPRIKTSNIFSKGVVIELSRLDDGEIRSLINLLQFQPKIAALVDTDFKRRSRDWQFERLRERCSADMFVCLANIFSNNSLDMILLAEFGELPVPLQDIYRLVAALESSGTRVHRQLMMRMTGMRADQVGSALSGLSGIIDEYDIRPNEGIFGWSTRHLVIARKIADYKFSSVADLEQLFNLIIDNINPAVQVELQSVRDICDKEYGIGRLGDSTMRQRLYRRLIKIAPAERIPWHRLIRELLDEDPIGDVEYVIRNAIEAVGADAPLDRYQVRLLVARSRKTVGLSEGDRIALLRKAYETADRNISHHRFDRYSYSTLCDVAVDLVKKGQAIQLLDEALLKMRSGAQIILDPEMAASLRYFEDTRNRLDR